MLGNPFACPYCHGDLVQDSGGLACRRCAAAFPVRGGMPDFVPALRRQPGLAQQFMESPTGVALYDRGLRRAFVWLLSSLRPYEERAYIQRWCEPVQGIVVDLACGTGSYTRLLAERASGARDVVVAGVDVSAAMLARARVVPATKPGTDIVFARASAQALPFPAGGVAAVNCWGALHLFPNPAAAIAEVGRVLGPGGTFTCLTVWRGSGARRHLAMSALLRIRLFDETQLRQWMAAAGLEVLDVTPRQQVALLAGRKSS